MEVSSASVVLAVFLLALTALHTPCNFFRSPADLAHLNLRQPTAGASADFGGFVSSPPAHVLRPSSSRDLSLLLRFLSASPATALTVAARGAGHSIHGQAQARGGIVVEMGSLPAAVSVHDGGPEGAYADVGGGALWSEVLEATLKHGLTPRSWTDYLDLSVGGTLSNAGVGGQAFKHGPQISNVLRLDVVTGTGELATCMPEVSPELFHAVLGGLGQFGIITGARIPLAAAPRSVRWVRAFYDDLAAFSGDQELLVTAPEKVDYVEGFLVLNEQSLRGASAAFPPDMEDFSHVLRGDASRVYYCLELAVYMYGGEEARSLEDVTSGLRCMEAHVYAAEVSYHEFLNRVRPEEASLRAEGLWDVPHPWLNMFVPRSGLAGFLELLLGGISKEDFQGPVLVYPLLRDKWDANTSAVLPDSPSNIFYIVGILRSAAPTSCSPQCLLDILEQNRRTTHTATSTGGSIGAKQYLPHYSSIEEWRSHFGEKWELFSARKALFDPLHILSPGQNIFQRVARVIDEPLEAYSQ